MPAMRPRLKFSFMSPAGCAAGGSWRAISPVHAVAAVFLLLALCGLHAKDSRLRLAVDPSLDEERVSREK